MRSTSWHVPHLPTYNAPPPSEIIFVIFLQRMPEEDRDRVIAKLNKTDSEWADRFVPQLRPRTLRPVPWIRDYVASSEAIIAMLEPQMSDRRALRRDGMEYKSSILVDSEWEAKEMCIIATWVDEKFDAAQVPMSIANVALTAIDQGAVEGLAEALGGEMFEENKIDLYSYRPRSRPPADDPIPYEIPASVKSVEAFSTDRITLLALAPLERSVVDSLKQTITQGTKDSQASKQPGSIEIVDWEGDPPSRQQVVKIFDYLDEQADPNNRIGYAFFVDNIWQGDKTGLPAVLAASRTCSFGNFVPDHQISLLPLRMEKVIDLWASAITAKWNDERIIENKIAPAEDEQRCGFYSRRERAVDTDFDIDYDGNGNSSFGVVYYLRPFDLSEQRTIRHNLADPRADTSWNDHEFAYMPYPFLNPPPPKTCHIVQDLRSAFERSDPLSPFFDPNAAPHRLNSYPRHFFALDDEVLDKNAPHAILLSCLDMYHESNMLGWTYGYVPADFAWDCHANLEIANMGPKELIGGETVELLLSDLRSYTEERGNEEEADR